MPASVAFSRSLRLLYTIFSCVFLGAQVGSSFLLMLDVIPAIVILISAAVAGLSADLNPKGDVWKVFEAFFTAFFIAAPRRKGPFRASKGPFKAF